MSLKKKKFFLAGHKGMVGSSILKHLKENNYKNIVTVNKDKLNLLKKLNLIL